jgi:chemotaxis protein MotB
MALKKREKSRVTSVWLTMYADFITSLTLFFILLFYSAMLAAKKSLTPSEMSDFNAEISGAMYDKENTAEKKAQSREQQIASAELEGGKAIKDFAGVVVNRREVVITLPEEVLFESGKAKIGDSARPVLKKIGELMARYPGKIVIEGHTDDVPINQQPPKGARLWEVAMARSTGLGPYASNWELSGARALQVETFFTREKIIDPARLVVRACGPSQPVAPNDSDEHRAKNRRIEIKTELAAPKK